LGFNKLGFLFELEPTKELLSYDLIVVLKKFCLLVFDLAGFYRVLEALYLSFSFTSYVDELTEIGRDGAWEGIVPASNILGPLFDSQSGVSLKSISTLSVSSQMESVFL
jgi:hypothetical protein